MKQFACGKRGGVPQAVWASVFAGVLAYVAYILWAFPRWCFWLLIPVFLIIFLAFIWRSILRRISVSQSEIRFRQNGIFKTTKRLARRRVTGTSVFASPLQRALGVCVLVVHTAGVALVVFGVRRSDAEEIIGLIEDAAP